MLLNYVTFYICVSHFIENILLQLLLGPGLYYRKLSVSEVSVSRVFSCIGIDNYRYRIFKELSV